MKYSSSEKELACQHCGEYKFVDDTHIKIKMENGYYQGNIYYYEIIKLDKEKLILRSDSQDIKLRKS